jgi:hypothetical protein
MKLIMKLTPVRVSNQAVFFYLIQRRTVHLVFGKVAFHNWKSIHNLFFL